MKLTASRSSDEPEINLVSLIDVVFCLIIFLVVTTTFTERQAMKLTLPHAQSGAQAEPGTPLVVIIDADGKFFLGENEVLRTDVAALKDAIGRVAGDDRTRPVILRADARSPHQATITAMDALGQLGFSRLSIATAPESK